MYFLKEISFDEDHFDELKKNCSLQFRIFTAVFKKGVTTLVYLIIKLIQYRNCV